MADSEAGGAADLQTDVMRFMAILAICLVAIFALVQSIPLDTTVPEAVVSPPEPKTVPTPVVTPAPRPEPEPEPETVVVTRPAPIVEPEPPAEPAAEPEPRAPPPREGFTLQFETDLALTRLAARNEVSLYAIGGDKSLRMSVNRGRLSFWPASTPNKFYEMEVSTVPEDVLAAYRRTSPENAQDVKWGVTLPTRTQQQLNDFLESADGGSLFIGANGDLRLEP
jgi:hypothetical protein